MSFKYFINTLFDPPVNDPIIDQNLQLLSPWENWFNEISRNLNQVNNVFLVVDTTAGPETVALMTTLLKSFNTVTVKDISGTAGANNITIIGQNGETIDGSPSVTISSNYGFYNFFSNGMDWFTW